ncbi:acyl-CoA dehydrogenase family protein [Pseudomonas sp. NFX15]|uniref:acyl-CoA dehydrogenase family protein n=1 Tax=Pseudomonas sp. NFX15 TaxID=2816958 RepID=UPI003B8E0A8A
MAALPEYTVTPEVAQFRAEVREWLSIHWPAERKAAHDALPSKQRLWDPGFSKELGEQGWIALSWPKRFGGQARSPMEIWAFAEEMRRAGAPLRYHGVASGVVAGALMSFGTEEQQQEWLPRIREGRVSFCLGYSEPGSGSDLASLRTRAERDGDEWVINGQKIWTTFAEDADYLWLAARTDAEATPQHAGISIFIVPMNAAGITLQPSMAMYGKTFANEFLDNVRVTNEALIGPENGGWKVITGALADERISMGGFVIDAQRVFDRIVDHILISELNGRPMSSDPLVRDRVAGLAAEIEMARQLSRNAVQQIELGHSGLTEAAMSKTFTGELMQRLCEAALDILGMGALLSKDNPGSLVGGEVEYSLRESIMLVIGGGTNEIQRTLIAQRGLGLPR